MNAPKIIAICTASPAFAENQILVREVAKKYPGALWIPELAKRLLTSGVDTLTGDIALRRVQSGDLSPENVWVIQEDRSLDADALIRLGAKAKILMCCESPLFAADFYRDLPKISQKFEHCMVFRGAIDAASPRAEKHVMYFPSFSTLQRNDFTAWSRRKFLVMVAGNKYWTIRRPLWRHVAAKIRDVIRRNPQRFSKEYASKQLHDQRLAMIYYFGDAGKLDLFGTGWENLRNLPVHWQKKIKEITEKKPPRPCLDKLVTIADYRFAICFENIEFPGYVTEKIIDCLVAGVIPVYWGAPDIRDFIPEGCYVDAKKFETLGHLRNYLENLSEVDGLNMLISARSFLAGERGKRYSYEYFADRIQKMLVKKN